MLQLNQRTVDESISLGTQAEIFWVDNARFYELLIDLHNRANGEVDALVNARVERLSPEEAQDAFISTRNRWLSLMCIAPDEIVQEQVFDLIDHIGRRGSFAGLTSLFFSGWSRGREFGRLTESAAALWEQYGGSVSNDAGLSEIPMLDSDGNGLTFIDVAALGRLGGARFGSIEALEDAFGGRGNPSSAKEGGTAQDIVTWSFMIGIGVLGAYVGMKGGGTLGTILGAVGAVGGRDLGKEVYNAFAGLIVTKKVEKKTPVDVTQPPGDAGTTTGPQSNTTPAPAPTTTDDGDRDGDGDGDDGDGDDGDGDDVDVSDTAGGDSGGDGSVERPTDDGGTTDGGVTAASRIVLQDVTLDLAYWSSFSGFGGSGSSGTGRSPGSPGGLGLAGLMTPNPETGEDAAVWRVKVDSSVDLSTPGVRMPGPGGLRMMGAVMPPERTMAAAIVVSDKGARWGG